MRMKERDVLAEEVRGAIENPTHLKRGKRKGRYEAEKIYHPRKITVVYDKLAKDEVYVITVY